MTAGGFSVEHAALGTHAGQLEGAGARLGEAAGAANATLSEDAYGIICGFIASATADTAARMRDAVQRLAETTTAHSDGVRGSLADYQGMDERNAASFGGDS